MGTKRKGRAVGNEAGLLKRSNSEKLGNNHRLGITSKLDWSLVRKYFMRDSSRRFYICKIFQDDKIFGYHSSDSQAKNYSNGFHMIEQRNCLMIDMESGALGFFACKSQSEKDRTAALQEAVSSCDARLKT